MTRRGQGASAWCAMLAVGVVLAGCGDSRFLTGRYCSSEPMKVPSESAPWTEARYVSLEIGHYGPDVGGVVGFHDDENCVQDFKASDRCPCAPIEAGVYNYDDKVNFLFEFRHVTNQGCEETGPVCADKISGVASGRLCEWEDETIHVVLNPTGQGSDLSIVEFGPDSVSAPLPTSVFFRKQDTSATDLVKEDKFRNQCEALFSGGAP